MQRKGESFLASGDYFFGKWGCFSL